MCLWYAQHTCPFGCFWMLDEEVHPLTRLAYVWPGRVEPIGSKLQSLSKFAELEVDGFLDVLNAPDGQSQHWAPGACCSSPVQKIDTGVPSSNMSHFHRNSSKQTFALILNKKVPGRYASEVLNASATRPKAMHRAQSTLHPLPNM